MHLHFLRFLFTTQADASTSSGDGTTGQARENILAEQSCQKRTFARSCVPDHLDGVLTSVIKCAGSLGKVVTQPEYLLRLDLLELGAFKEFCSCVCTL